MQDYCLFYLKAFVLRGPLIVSPGLVPRGAAGLRIDTIHQTKKINNNKKFTKLVNLNYSTESSHVLFKFDGTKDSMHKNFLTNFKTKTVCKENFEKSSCLWGSTTLPLAAIRLRLKHAVARGGEGSGEGVSRPRASPYYLINSPPLVYSASRHYDDER
ncbi:unnamed protein product [Colias eurytheme]|nr:unnamed protein product [Colias eurytheme]